MLLTFLPKKQHLKGSVVEANLVEDAEKALFAELQAVTPVVEPLLAAKDYTAALSKRSTSRAD